MDQDAPSGEPNIFPELVYGDVTAAMKWLEQAFGFRATEVTTGPDGEVYHAEMRLGPGTIMVEPATEDNEFGMRTPRSLGGVNQAVCVYVDDPDAHYERARAAGAEILVELRTTNYGARSYLARDLDGHLWTFSDYRPSGKSSG